MTDLNKGSLANLTRLCRINCSDKELDTLLKSLQSILKYVDQLKEVNTKDVSICNHVNEEMTPFMREDEATESLDRKTFLGNSPSQVGGMVRVPTVIEF